MNELKKLAEYSSQLSIENLPDKVMYSARYCVLDSIGSALGAAYYEEIPGVIGEIECWVGTNTEQSATIWGHKKKMNIFAAALLNGLMSHALELDDVHSDSKAHIGAIVVPAAWVVAEATGASGKDFLQAVIAGYEVMARVGRSIDVASHRKKGWHATGTMGTFGAAAAVARLFSLDIQHTIWAFGIAGTQSSGLWAFLEEGSSCKKLHTARAILNGITAALLSKSSMSGPEHILDARDGGFYRATSDFYDMKLLTQGLGEDYEITKIDKKIYPCCRSTHPSIDAALFIRDKYEIKPEDIENIKVETYEVGVIQCGTTKYPDNWVEAKFSTAYVTAIAFVKGQVTQEHFMPDVINDPLIRRLAENTTVISDEMFTKRYPKRWGCRMRVTLKNDEVIIKEIDDMIGSIIIPLTVEQEMNKFLSLATPIIGKERSVEVMNKILTIDSQERLPELSCH
jgi:2-methylcitrate dehydratase PrpD